MTKLPEICDIGIYYPKVKKSVRMTFDEQGKPVIEDEIKVTADEKLEYFYIAD